jgi:predicted nucleic acid-binding protein
LTTREKAHALLARALALPLEIRSLRDLAGGALDSALAHGLSVYDACYVVLAESLGATLITADRRLAAAVDRSELVE